MNEALFFWPGPCDVLTGFGAACLLQFSALSPSAENFKAVVFGAGIAALLFAHFYPSRKALPPWLALCNCTFALLVGLALTLNVFAQLSPPSGKELALIPTYVILCIPRGAPSRLALIALAAMTGFVALWCLVPSDASWRPAGDAPLSFGEMVALSISVFFGCSFSPLDASDETELLSHSGKGGLFGVLVKTGALLVLGCLGQTQLYSFMFERQGAASVGLQVCYGILLCEACMVTAALWFVHLRAILSRATSRVVVRMQHIIYAVLLAAAWSYPLQLQLLRQLLVCLLLSLNLVFRLTG